METQAWPALRAAQVRWTEARISAWLASGEAIGLDPALAAELQMKLAQARQAMDDAVRKRTAAKSATAKWHTLSTDFRACAGAAIQSIRAHAQATGDPAVYAQAFIAPPAQRTAPKTPQTPWALATGMTNGGGITLKWKYKNPRGGGTSFMIFRELEGEESYRLLASTTRKSFSDLTVPQGTTSIRYMVRALRAGKMSDISAPIIVYLGAVAVEGSQARKVA